jgi:hypothetical protein
MIRGTDTVINQVALFKSSLLLRIGLQNTLTLCSKLKWKLFTNVIKIPGEEAWVVIDRVSN